MADQGRTSEHKIEGFGQGEVLVLAGLRPLQYMSGTLVAEDKAMSHCLAAALPSRGVVRVAGTDARKFLQGLVTNDVGKARNGTAIHAGLLTPQGKILFDFFVVPAGEGFLLEAPRSAIAELAKRLSFYRLRAAVGISEEPSFSVVAAWGDTPRLPGEAIAYADPRLPNLGLRILLPLGVSLDGLHCAAATQADYDAMRIGLGVPEGGRDFVYGEAFPHEALFDQLHGVDFTKGCFIGQEVVARMEHRGTARKRIVPIEGDRSLPASGTEITAGGAPVGTLASVNGKLGLALLRLDRAEQALAAGASLKAGDATVRLRRPDWMRFGIPSATMSA
jgi:folate-binding protein YgfZ